MRNQEFRPKEVKRRFDDKNETISNLKMTAFLVIAVSLVLFLLLFQRNISKDDPDPFKVEKNTERSFENDPIENEKSNIESPKYEENIVEEDTKGGNTGGRSRASIMQVVMNNLAALRYAYNKRLREMPGLKGRVTVKFAIDEFGKVVFCSIVSSTMNDKVLEDIVKAKILKWKFNRINKPGDVTEVVYPFVFSQ